LESAVEAIRLRAPDYLTMSVPLRSPPTPMQALRRNPALMEKLRPQNHDVMHVGSLTSRRVDARVIGATHRDLYQAMRKIRFARISDTGSR
jgi:hypothetical protein